MTELQLYKFINDHECEWRWEDDGHLIIFVNWFWLKEFCQMLGRNIFDNDGLPCEQHLCADGEVCLYKFENILDYFGIEPENVFPKDKEN
jgi:hypothetical protein